MAAITIGVHLRGDELVNTHVEERHRWLDVRDDDESRVTLFFPNDHADARRVCDSLIAAVQRIKESLSVEQ